VFGTSAGFAADLFAVPAGQGGSTDPHRSGVLGGALGHYLCDRVQH
jgi:hypothetical protein